MNMNTASTPPVRRVSIIELINDAIEATKLRAERIVAEVPVLDGAGKTQLKRIALLQKRTDAVAKAELARADAERVSYMARNTQLEADLEHCSEILTALSGEIPKAREPGWSLTYGSPVETGLREYLRELEAAAKEPQPANIPFPFAARKQLEHRRASINALIGLLTRKERK